MTPTNSDVSDSNEEMRMYQWRRIRLPRGFTLVELMIAMALVGILVALIYAMFVRTADSLSAADGQAAALDQARYGIGQVRTALAAAGSHATPNSRQDPWMLSESQGAPTPSPLHGIIHNDLEDLNDMEDHGYDGVVGNNPKAGFSDVIILGAIDTPASMLASFDTAQLQPDSEEATFIIEGTERGLDRMIAYNPFKRGVVNAVSVPDNETLEDRVEESLIRVQDQEGFFQILPVKEDGATVGSHAGAAGGTTVTGDSLAVEVDGLHFREGDQPGGFEMSVEDDVSFDVALIDAYRFYVRPAPGNPRNLRLLRQRVDATQVYGQGDSADPDPVGPPMVIAERVADFRVWFDCRGGNDSRSIGSIEWYDQWDVPVEDNCVADGNPHRAQIAHARLSTRTENENPNRPHMTLEDGWEGFAREEGQMQTFELHSAVEGSAAVTTTQASVELTNFSMRNLADDPDGGV